MRNELLEVIGQEVRAPASLQQCCTTHLAPGMMATKTERDTPGHIGHLVGGQGTQRPLSAALSSVAEQTASTSSVCTTAGAVGGLRCPPTHVQTGLRRRERDVSCLGGQIVEVLLIGLLEKRDGLWRCWWRQLRGSADRGQETRGYEALDEVVEKAPSAMWHAWLKEEDERKWWR